MSIRNFKFSHLYGAMYSTERGTTRVTRIRAGSISAAESLGKSMEQAGEELFAVWLTE